MLVLIIIWNNLVFRGLWAGMLSQTLTRCSVCLAVISQRCDPSWSCYHPYYLSRHLIATPDHIPTRVRRLSAVGDVIACGRTGGDGKIEADCGSPRHKCRMVRCTVRVFSASVQVHWASANLSCCTVVGAPACIGAVHQMCLRTAAKD